jgi:hypothetical protein
VGLARGLGRAQQFQKAAGGLAGRLVLGLGRCRFAQGLPALHPEGVCLLLAEGADINSESQEIAKSEGQVSHDVGRAAVLPAAVGLLPQGRRFLT